MDREQKDLCCSVSKSLITISQTGKNKDDIEIFGNSEFAKILLVYDKIASDFESDIAILRSRLKQLQKEHKSKYMDEEHKSRLEEIFELTFETKLLNNRLSQAYTECSFDEKANSTFAQIIADRYSLNHGAEILDGIYCSYNDLCSSLRNKLITLENSLLDNMQSNKGKRIRKEIDALKEDYNRCFHKKYIINLLIEMLR